MSNNPQPEPDDDLTPAATVLLLRDTADGVEVLMVKRNSKIAFGGMWAFPGGRVDDEDLVPGDVLASARVAAAREVAEETGLVVSAADLTPWSYWVPPPRPAIDSPGPRRRFSTWFFVAPAPAGEVAIDHGEIHDDRWLTPTAALEQHRAGEIELVPPTWITLTQLAVHAGVAEAVAWADATESPEFQTKPIGRDPLTIAWAGDAAFDGPPEDDDGSRNRLVLDPAGWRYLNS